MSKEEKKQVVEEAATSPDAEALNAAREEGKKVAREASSANLGALKTAFPEDPAYVMECFEQGMTVAEAKLSRYDARERENADLHAEIDELKAQVSEGSPPVGSVDAQAEADAAAVEKAKVEAENDADGRHPWMVAVEKVKADRGVNFSAARKIVDARDGGKLHGEYVKQCPVVETPGPGK